MAKNVPKANENKLQMNEFVGSNKNGKLMKGRKKERKKRLKDNDLVSFNTPIVRVYYLLHHLH